MIVKPRSNQISVENWLNNSRYIHAVGMCAAVKNQHQKEISVLTKKDSKLYQLRKASCRRGSHFCEHYVIYMYEYRCMCA